ncbi:four helix bundle protein [bacterium]|nr:four helix bundle protein [bacterium]
MGRMENHGRFEDLIVWQKAQDLGVIIYSTSGSGQFARDFGIKNQIRRASLSVSSNIAEGQGRYSNKEFKNYLSIANGSLYEVISLIHFSEKLNLVTRVEALTIISKCSEISKMIKGLRNSI